MGGAPPVKRYGLSGARTLSLSFALTATPSLSPARPASLSSSVSRSLSQQESGESGELRCPMYVTAHCVHHCRALLFAFLQKEEIRRSMWLARAAELLARVAMNRLPRFSSKHISY